MRDLTTSQAGRLMRVSCRTVQKWIDRKLLKGHTVARSRHRRVLTSDLITFAANHEIPLDQEMLRELHVATVAT